MKTPTDLIEEMIKTGGAIVSSDACEPLEIAIARACGKFALHGDYGLVLKPKGWVSAAKEGLEYRLIDAAMRTPAPTLDEEIAEQANAGTLNAAMRGPNT